MRRVEEAAMRRRRAGAWPAMQKHDPCAGARFESLWRAAPYQRREEGQHEQDDKYEEEQLRDRGGRHGNPGKAEDAGNDGDDEENDSPIKHRTLLSKSLSFG